MNCGYCGQDFDLPAYWIENEYEWDMHFCSNACRDKFREMFPSKRVETCSECSSDNYRILKCLVGNLRVCRNCGNTWNYNKEFQV